MNGCNNISFFPAVFSFPSFTRGIRKHIYFVLKSQVFRGVEGGLGEREMFHNFSDNIFTLGKCPSGIEIWTGLSPWKIHSCKPETEWSVMSVVDQLSWKVAQNGLVSDAAGEWENKLGFLNSAQVCHIHMLTWGSSHRKEVKMRPEGTKCGILQHGVKDSSAQLQRCLYCSRVQFDPSYISNVWFHQTKVLKYCPDSWNILSTYFPSLILELILRR